jgi:hypothetical protein
MSESDALPVGEVTSRKAGGEGPLSVWDAARSLSQTRYKEQAEAGRQAEAAQEAPKAEEPAEQPAEPPKELAEEANAAPEEASGETQEVEPEAPAIDPPKSWNKEARERWANLDRETQEYLVERDREDQANIKRSLNEAAERSKSVKDKETAAEQMRSQYEQALPLLEEAIRTAHMNEFADIKTVADVERLAREDWPRYVLWDAQQKKIAAVQQETRAAQERQNAEKAQQWTSFAKEQDAKFIEQAPEFADEKVAASTFQHASKMLSDLGFDQEELGRLWNGQDKVSLRDHRLQLLIRDGVRYREAQAAAKTVRAAPKPPVQRPGAAPSKATGIDAQIQALTKQMQSANGLQQIRLASQITSLRRQAAASR